MCNACYIHYCKMIYCKLYYLRGISEVSMADICCFICWVKLLSCSMTTIHMYTYYKHTYASAYAYLVFAVCMRLNMLMVDTRCWRWCLGSCPGPWWTGRPHSEQWGWPSQLWCKLTIVWQMTSFYFAHITRKMYVCSMTGCKYTQTV